MVLVVSIDISLRADLKRYQVMKIGLKEGTEEKSYVTGTRCIRGSGFLSCSSDKSEVKNKTLVKRGRLKYRFLYAIKFTSPVVILRTKLDGGGSLYE